MNGADLRALAERASTVEGRQAERLAEVHARIRAARRRRTAAASAGAGVVVLALVLGVSALTRSTDQSQEPVQTPTPTPTTTPTPVVDNPDSLRPLTYAVGSTIQYGDRSIDVGEYVHFVDVTDNGVVFVSGRSTWKQHQRAALRFTDGSSVVQIGTVTGSPYTWFRVESSVAGSILVWDEDPGDDQGDYVVFDTEDMRVLARVPQSAAGDQVLSVHDDAVYWVGRERGGLQGGGQLPRLCTRQDSGAAVRRRDGGAQLGVRGVVRP